MAIDQISPEQFVDMITRDLGEVRYIRISVNKDQACPRFEIAGQVRGTTDVTGFYCPVGNSYLQVSHSGREEFTGSRPSSERFMRLIKNIVSVLAERGCVEKQWRTAAGELKKSVISLPIQRAEAIRHRDVYHLGKAPHFWERGLISSEKRFEPFNQGEGSGNVETESEQGDRKL